MVEFCLIVVGIWCLLVSWGVINLYLRTGLPADDIDLLREFAEKMRNLARIERRRAKRER